MLFGNSLFASRVLSLMANLNSSLVKKFRTIAIHQCEACFCQHADKKVIAEQHPVSDVFMSWTEPALHGGFSPYSANIKLTFQSSIL